MDHTVYNPNAIALRLMDVDRYRKRLMALIGGPLHRYRQKFAMEDSANPSLVKLLTEFDHFARSYFDFFLQGDPLASLPSELNMVLTRLQYFAETISRACEQREIEEFAGALAEADEQAQQYYDRFHGHKPDPKVAPIVYFEKIFGIRRSLYAPYPLVSIPLLFFNDKEQWHGGLAHELGHYIYWNSSSLERYEEVRSRLASIVLHALNVSLDDVAAFQRDSRIAQIWMNWLEEVFADVCGTLLVGPAYVLSAQRLANESDDHDDPYLDDGEHPAPYIRPVLALETLAWVAEESAATEYKAKLEAIIALLKDVWAAQRKVGGARTHETSGLMMLEIDGKAEAVVRAILGGSKRVASSGNWVGQEGSDEADLGSLIDVSPWLTKLPAEADRVWTLDAFTPITLTQDDVIAHRLPWLPQSPSQSFKQLLEYLKGKLNSETDIRQALLLMEFDDSRGHVCEQRWVKTVKGKLVLC